MVLLCCFVFADASGIGQATASFARIVGPVPGGMLFAWSERNRLLLMLNTSSHSQGRWPLNYHFVWIVLTLLCGFLLVLCRQLPPSIENMKPNPVGLLESEKDPQKDREDMMLEIE